VEWCTISVFSLISHLLLLKLLTEEDKLILEGMQSILRPKNNFYHFEEKFMNFGETVTIWCFDDFVDNLE
jgi:hypothetical protein